MVRALRTHGVDAEIATTTDDGDGVLDVPVEQLTERDGVPVRYFPRFSPPLRPVREFAYSRPLARWLETAVGSYDLLHVHAIFSYPSTRAMVTARQCGVPYLNRPLGQLCEWSLQQRSLKKRVYLRFVERANLDGAAAIHYTTEQEELEAVELGLRAPGFVAPHGVDLPALIPDARVQLRQRLELRADAKVVLFLSRVHPKKGLELLIGALAKIRDDSLVFLLAGNAETETYDARIRELLQSSGLGARSRRIPFAVGEWKQILLQGADVFALTSHSENFGLAVVEAMSARLPVLITPGVALADQVAQHQAGEVVPMEEPAVATAIARLLADRESGQRMGEAGRRMVSQVYAWPSVVARIATEYQRITR